MSSAHSARTSPSARAGRGSPVQGPQDTCTPGHAYSHSVSNTRYSTCLPARSASHSRLPGAPTKISPDAYRSPNTCAGKALIQAEINTLTSTRVPSCLTELIMLGKTFKRRATDILAYFDHPHTTGGPTEAINASPQTPTRLRPQDFRDLTNYITRALLEIGGFKPPTTPQL